MSEQIIHLARYLTIIYITPSSVFCQDLWDLWRNKFCRPLVFKECLLFAHFFTDYSFCEVLSAVQQTFNIFPDNLCRESLKKLIVMLFWYEAEADFRIVVRFAFRQDKNLLWCESVGIFFRSQIFIPRQKGSKSLLFSAWSASFRNLSCPKLSIVFVNYLFSFAIYLVNN